MEISSDINHRTRPPSFGGRLGIYSALADGEARNPAQSIGHSFVKGSTELSGSLAYRLGAAWLSDRCGNSLAIGGETSTTI
jgi:hypothetical protein